MVHVDSTAVVDPKAVLDHDVSIGPYCVVGPDAFIGSGTKLLNHVTVMGNVRIGHDNVFYPQCVIGGEPQDLGYRGESTWVVIGDRNTFREGCTVHRATTKEFGVTRIGNDNFLMAMAHVAHDCRIDNRVIVANMTQISGHCHIQDSVVLSGMIGLHQWVTVGRFAFIGAMSRVRTDIAPFMLYEGLPCEAKKVNLVGLRRNGIDRKEIMALCEAQRILFRHGLAFEQAKREVLAAYPTSPCIAELIGFMDNSRGGLKGRGREGRKAA